MAGAADASGKEGHMVGVLIQTVGGALAMSLAAAILCAVVRPRPAICHAIWLLVLVKLLMPPVVAWPWQPEALFAQTLPTASLLAPVLPLKGVLSSAPDTRSVFSSGDAFPGAVSGDTAGMSDFPSGAGVQTAQPAFTSVPAPVAEAAVDSRGIPWRLLGWAGLGVWFVGALVASVVHMVRIARFRRIVRGGEPAPAWLLAKTAELAGAFGMRAPETRVADELWSAMLWGVRRPMILVPRRALDDIEPVRWETVVAHELAHLKRRDHWTAWIVLAASCVWWWNPILWWARRRVARYGEMACDAWVLWALPERGKEYADTLLRFVEDYSSRRRMVAAPMPCMSDDHARAFEKRLAAILRGPAPYRLGVAGVACVVLLAAVVLPVFSQQSPNSPFAVAEPAPLPSASPPALPAASEPAPAKADPRVVGETSKGLLAALDAPVSIDFTNVHVADVAAFLGETYGISVVVDWRVVKAPPLPVAPPATPGTVAVAPADPLPGESKSLSESSAPTRDSAASDTIVTDGILVQLRISDIPLREALDALLRPLNLVCVTYPNLLFLTSPEMAVYDSMGLRPVVAGYENLKDQLQTPVSLEFHDVHVSEILEFITETHAMNIVVDWRGVAKPGYPGYDGTSEQLASTGIVPAFQVSDVPLGEALDALLRSINLTYYPEKNYVWVTSFDEIEQRQLPGKPTDPGGRFGRGAASGRPDASVGSGRLGGMDAARGIGGGIWSGRLGGVRSLGCRDDFESATAGGWPEQWIADGNATERDQCYVDSSTFGPMHGHTLRLSATTDGWAALAHVETRVKEPFRVSFDVFMDGSNPAGEVVVGVRERPEWTAPGVLLFSAPLSGPVRVLERVVKNGDVLQGQTSDPLRLQPGKWYRVVLELKQADDRERLTVSVDDGQTVQGPVEFNVDEILVKDMPYLQLEMRTGLAWFDNVVMTNL